MRQRDTSRYRLNLALQGGGAHGAFTWGVLDRLLEDGRLAIDTISGTSAGAVNAAALATGFADGGAAGARASLERTWCALHKASVPEFIRLNPMFAGLGNANKLAARSFGHLANTVSPYQFNPLDINPLRRLLRDTIDFDALARQREIGLRIAATSVESGLARIFTTAEITCEVILASACLPTLHHAIIIDGAHYWDGGFSANPDIVGLASESGTQDTLLVLLNPRRRTELPTSARDIAAHVAHLTFNQPFLRDVQLLDAARRSRPPLFGRGRGRDDRLRAHRFHLIEAERYTGRLGPDSKLKPDWAMLSHLHMAGRIEAERWLDLHLEAVGHTETADLPALFLEV